ncbi:hypothetical protein GUJ93_ZPchr0002g22992 [Zizania palustris]|uniref:Uncharacterized protein n=1 Tax=Zizania palustris TaxID=103762 RepID=A0A8J5SMM9_ZIZPA|nr:hypothetical protein GUJ93_ZPchr0002g22992 [Zizania palustris]
MACSAAAAAAAAATIEGEVFTEEELEVAATLEKLADLVRARSSRSRRRRSSEGAVIPSWGCRRRTSMPEDKPATPVLDRSQEPASPNTPLVLHDESGGDDANEPAAKKERTHAEVIRTASAYDDLKPDKERVEATASAIDLPAPAPARVLGLDLNEPPVESLSEDNEEAWWRLLDEQQRPAMPNKAAITAAARRRRREILRAKRPANGGSRKFPNLYLKFL